MAFNLYKKKDKKVILHTLSLSVIAVLSSISLSFTDLSSLNIAFTNSKYALAFTPVPGPVNTTAGLTLEADKPVYAAEEYVILDGKVDKVIPGERVRLDLYDPAGKPISLGINQFIEPDDEGFFSYSGPGTTPQIPSDAKAGEYTFLATYDRQGVETKIMVRQSGSQTQQESPPGQENPLGQLGESLGGGN
jgi:hypothetical protein